MSCAHELVKGGHEVIVYEASDQVGGMSKSFQLWNQIVDLGPHRFFSKNVRINNFFKEAIGEDYTLVNRLTRIYYKGSFFNYPLKIFNVLTNLNLITVVQILYYYVKQRLAPIKDPQTFEEWVTNRFGLKLYEIFFKNYSEKLWGIECSKIDADWAAQRIKTLSLIGAVWSALTGNRGNKHKTLVDQFAYPNKGTGAIYENIAKTIESSGGQINLSSPIKKLIIAEQSVVGVVLQDETEVKADIVISTMPMTSLVKGIDTLPNQIKEACDQLYFRNTILVYLEVEGQGYFKDNWIYVHSPDVKHGRITNFANWSPGILQESKNTILCLEFWAFDTDSIWTDSDITLGDLAKEEVRKINILPDGTNILNHHVVRINKCYPVYETGYQVSLNKIVSYLNGFENLNLIGRYGSFKYNNQDHSILMGLMCAENIIKGQQVNDLWAINTDTEYQEEGKIKDVLAG